MNIKERNQEIGMAAQNLEELFLGVGRDDVLIPADMIEEGREQVKRLIAALDGYPVNQQPAGQDSEL